MCDGEGNNNNNRQEAQRRVVFDDDHHDAYERCLSDLEKKREEIEACIPHACVCVCVCVLSLAREQSTLRFLCSLTPSAARNKYHKWNREYHRRRHESAQDEKRLSLSC